MGYKLKWVNNVELIIKDEQDQEVGKAYRHEGTRYNVFTADLRDCGQAPNKDEIIATYLSGKDKRRAAPEPSICPGCPFAVMRSFGAVQ